MFGIAVGVGVATLVAVAVLAGARRSHRHRGSDYTGDPARGRSALDSADATIGLQRNSSAGYPR